MRTLIADDDEVTQLGLSAVLTRRGYKVTAAADGASADAR